MIYDLMLNFFFQFVIQLEAIRRIVNISGL